jgi:putative transcriptional regulator
MVAKTYRSEPLAAIHEMMEALHNIGAIDKKTMRDFDHACQAQLEAPPQDDRR